MAKRFNTTGVCVDKKRYMVNIDKKRSKIDKLIDNEAGLNRKEFSTRLGNSNDIKSFAVRELKKLGVANVFKMPFKESNLEAYLSIHKEEIESCLAIDIKSIVKWASDRYEEIITMMDDTLI